MWSAAKGGQDARASILPVCSPFRSIPRRKGPVWMQCPAMHAMSSSIRSYALPRTSEGGRKLPRTVRVSYRLNGLPALPPPDAGVAREGAVPLDAHFPSIDGAPVCKCSPDARCDVLPMRRFSRCALGFESADEAVRTSHDDVVWPRAARRGTYGLRNVLVVLH